MTFTKTIILSAVCALVGATAFSQASFGLKGGLNYSGNGNYFESVGDAAKEPDKNIGFHLGAYTKVALGRVYLRPELIYTETNADYDSDDFKVSKLDLPLLIGLRIIGPLHVFTGPSFQYILNTRFEGIGINDIESNFTVGAHIGAGVDLGKVGIDLRYERGFNENEARFINTNLSSISTTTLPTSRIDTRPEQVILSFSIKL